MRYRYALLAYAGNPNEEPSSPIAVVCVCLDATENVVTLFVRNDWEQKVKENHKSYIENSFHDWVQLMDEHAKVLLSQILAFSVGPLRAVGDGECDEQELHTRVEQLLKVAYRRLT